MAFIGIKLLLVNLGFRSWQFVGRKFVKCLFYVLRRLFRDFRRFFVDGLADYLSICSQVLCFQKTEISLGFLALVRCVQVTSQIRVATFVGASVGMLFSGAGWRCLKRFEWAFVNFGFPCSLETLWCPMSKNSCERVAAELVFTNLEYDRKNRFSAFSKV